MPLTWYLSLSLISHPSVVRGRFNWDRMGRGAVLFLLPCISILSFIKWCKATFLSDNESIWHVVRRFSCMVMSFVLGEMAGVGMIKVATRGRSKIIWTSQGTESGVRMGRGREKLSRGWHLYRISWMMIMHRLTRTLVVGMTIVLKLMITSLRVDWLIVRSPGRLILIAKLKGTLINRTGGRRRWLRV
jgi:hypothetical protein